MSDRLVRATALGGKVRGFAVNTTGVVGELQRRHDTWPTASAALGRTLSAAVMMGAMLKGNERLTVQIKGNGPIGQIVVDANANGEVRGYVDHPHVDLPLNSIGKLDVAGAVGTEGMLNVIKDLGMKEPYQGNIPLVSGELGDDFTYYFYKSEQTPSAVGVGVLVNPDGSILAAGGFIIQLLPGLDEASIAEIEENIVQLKSVTDLIHQGVTPEGMLAKLLPDVRILDEMPVIFKCKCSHERIESMLISLGKEQLRELIEEKGEAEVVCHFCNERYQFKKEELEQLEKSL